jgi:sugar/nucleoside kinase (ribokinase family)
MRNLSPISNNRYKYRRLIGTGGIGSGMFFRLEGNHTLGRNESRAGFLVPCRDYCKLHIISHYVSVLLGAEPQGGFRTYPLGSVGNDDVGLSLVEEMKAAGMSVEGVKIRRDASTLYSVCFQYPDSTGGNITTSNSASAKVTPEFITAFFNGFAAPENEELILAAPEVPLDTRIKLLEAGRQRGSFNVAAVLVSEVEDFIKENGLGITDLLAVNIDEAGAIAGLLDETLPSEEIACACVEKLNKANPDIIAVITDGPNGSYGFMNNRLEFVPPLKAQAMSTAGAGDAFLAGTIAGLCCGLSFLKGEEDAYFGETPIKSAMELGTTLASLSVTVADSIHQTADAELLLKYITDRCVKLSPEFRMIFDRI